MSTVLPSPLYPPFSGTPLRVLVLLGCERVPGWLARTLHDVAGCAHVVAEFIHVSGAGDPPRLGWSAEAFLQLDGSTAGSMLPVLELVPLPADLLDRKARASTDANGHLVLDPQSMATVSGSAPHLILVVGLPVAAIALSRLARHGAWTLEPHACHPVSCGLWMLGAFARGEPTAVVGLCVHQSTQGRWALLEPGVISPARLSFARHRAYQLQKAPQQLARSLRRLADDQPLRWAPMPPGPETNAIAVLGLLGRLSLRAARRALASARGVDCWMVGVQRRQSHVDPEHPDVGELKRLHPPLGWFWADPFPWREQGRDWVMIEALDYRSGRGEIQALELDDALDVGKVHPVLRLGHHLSYPFLFRWDSSTWMVVESSAAARATLYRCTRFPDQWDCEGDLIAGCRIVDSTLCEHDGRWWLFGCVSESAFDDGGRESNELFVFHAPTPRGPWQPHACNPVCVDVSRSRPAGPLFRHDGRLIRPAQDGSIEYGRAVQFNQVVTLTPDVYEERPLGRLAADWHPSLRGCHTYACHDGLMAIDGKFSAPRSHARPSRSIRRQETLDAT